MVFLAVVSALVRRRCRVRAAAAGLMVVVVLALVGLVVLELALA